MKQKKKKSNCFSAPLPANYVSKRNDVKGGVWAVRWKLIRDGAYGYLMKQMPPSADLSVPPWFACSPPHRAPSGRSSSPRTPGPEEWAGIIFYRPKKYNTTNTHQNEPLKGLPGTVALFYCVDIFHLSHLESIKSHVWIFVIQLLFNGPDSIFSSATTDTNIA